MRSPRLQPVLVLITACLAFSACEEETPDFDGDPEVPPEDPADIEAWSKLHGYRAWPADSEPHPGGSGHPGDVRVFLSPELDDSMAAGNMHHPAGAMAVKELYDGDGKVRGVTVMLKLKETTGDNPDPKAWYWWERADGEIVADGEAEPVCTSCHSAAFGTGTDYVRSEYPLR